MTHTVQGPLSELSQSENALASHREINMHEISKGQQFKWQTRNCKMLDELEDNKKSRIFAFLSRMSFKCP